jgi:hypothetical protein
MDDGISYREKRRRELLDAYNAAIEAYHRHRAEADACKRTADQYVEAYEREGFGTDEA